MKPETNPKTIFSVAGGKGGVGKSIFSVALGAALAKQGHRTALVDLDLGAANLHTYLGIISRTKTIADFILRRVPTLEEILLDTAYDDLKVISGAEFVPGMANPAHWMKLKIIRHIRALPADFIIIDLGAGVHFNTLDFFGMSNRGIVITAPEPGAVMNAYSFIKAALFRRLQGVFKKHPLIGPLIEAKTKNPEDEKKFSIEWLTEKVQALDPEMLPLIYEIESEFRPALVVNRVPEGEKPLLVKNLISLCAERLGVTLEHAGNLPDTPEMGKYLLNIPMLLDIYAGQTYLESVKKISGRLLAPCGPEQTRAPVKAEYSDEEVEEIITFIEGLDEEVFSGTDRDTWKLRMYFKPSDVVSFLISRGVTHDIFYR